MNDGRMQPIHDLAESIICNTNIKNKIFFLKGIKKKKCLCHFPVQRIRTKSSEKFKTFERRNIVEKDLVKKI